MRNFAIPPLVTLQPSPAEQNGSFRSTSSAYWSSPLYYSSLHERFTNRGGGVYTHGSDRVAWVRTQSVGGVRFLKETPTKGIIYSLPKIKVPLLLGARKWLKIEYAIYMY